MNEKHKFISDIRKKAEEIISSKSIEIDNHLDALSAKEIQKLFHELEVHQIELEMQNEELLYAHTELNEVKKRYFNLYDLAPIGYCTLNEEGLIKETNLEASHLFGLNRNILINKAFSDFVQKDDQDIYYLFRKKILKTNKQEECELRLVQKNGTIFWGHLSAIVEIKKDKTFEIRILINSICERKKSEAKLKISASVFSHTNEAIMITSPDGIIYDVNEAFETITGYSKKEAIGKMPNILSSGYHKKQFYTAMIDSLKRDGKWTGETWNSSKSGKHFAAKFIINAIYNEDDSIKHYVALFSDVTASKDYIKELESIANYDVLTGLPNRRLLTDRLHQNMIQVERRNELLAVIFLDLDGFKNVNDNYGHEIGDKLLIELSVNMRSALREEDTISRIGGDEFIVVLSNLINIETSLPLINRLVEAASQKIKINEDLIQISASLGITFYPQLEEIEPDQLIRQADQAMYESKISGKNRYHIFNIKQNNSIKERYESVERIQKALDLNEFVLHYQPQVNMRTGEIIGVESLIRWDNPTKGTIYPNEFLPIIYGHKLTILIGEWVMRTALAQIEQWQMIGLNIPISINISANHLLEENFILRLEEILLEYPKVESSFLQLEILESTKLEDINKAEKVINACKNFGIHFSLDDFGTGYSSLTYLQKLPVTCIKIDRSFVRDMLKDENELAILEAIIKLSDVFKRKVIAEGVETIDQVKVLLKLGCELAQGKIISMPMHSSEFPLWLKKWERDSSWGEKNMMCKN